MRYICVQTSTQLSRIALVKAGQCAFTGQHLTDVKNPLLRSTQYRSPLNCTAVSRIALVKPDKARAVENMILASAQRGQITEKISEERLVSMLEQISEKEGAAKKITITRRRPAFSDEDD